MVARSLDLLSKNLPLLLDGLASSLQIALASVTLALLIGFAVGTAHLSPSPTLRKSAKIYLEAFRIIPVIVWLFVAFFAIPIAFNLTISGETAAILIFSLWGGAEMSDLVRGALSSIPVAQYEAGRALGLSETQLYRQVIVPQAIRRLLPGAVNLITRMIKTTSLVVLVGVVDVVKRAQQIIERTHEALTLYAFLFVLFFALCYPLSLLSRWLERRWPA
jgi:polar amino acid transport system permease protein